MCFFFFFFQNILLGDIIYIPTLWTSKGGFAACRLILDCHVHEKLVDIFSESWSCSDIAYGVIMTSSFSVVLNPS